MPTFQLLQQQTISTLNIKAYIYAHQNSKAIHIHLDAPENTENVFMVAFRTLPEDSTGVAHILEHTTLCGSKNYPVRDPFFMMTRRSLNSFMNAMTSADWTAYPFASANKKDFDNLLNVYLDAVFFPNLNRLDFEQEGHRLEFEQLDDPNSKLQYKGVVYNEMKGAMSSETSVLWDSVSRNLYPTTTYQYNSGGDPEKIPDLTYEQLLDFHRTYYHPDNAIFLTYGDIPAQQHQQQIESLALSQFKSDNINRHFTVPMEKRYTEPQKVTMHYAVSSDSDLAKKSHVVMAWLLGDSTDINDLLDAIMLESILFNDSASPMQYCLENSEYGSISPMCGVETSTREICLLMGLENCDKTHTKLIEQSINNCLNDIANNGIDLNRLESILQQIELQQREITGDGYPFGMKLLMSILPTAIHRGDIIQHLNADTHLVALREKIKQPDYVKDLCERLLLNNKHCVLLTLEPDANLNEHKQQMEQLKLEKIKSDLNEEEQQSIVKRSQTLQQRQNQLDDSNLLPKVGITDIAKNINWATGNSQQVEQQILHNYATATNGIVYLQYITDVANLNLEEIELIPLYCRLMTELGAVHNGEFKDYETMQCWQSEVSGGISARFSISTHPSYDVRTSIILSAKALSYKRQELKQLLDIITSGVKFTELTRIKTLITQMATRAESGITRNAHVLAMSDSAKNINSHSALENHLNGITRIKYLKQLDSITDDTKELQTFANKLTILHEKLCQFPSEALIVAEEDTINTLNNNWTLSHHPDTYLDNNWDNFQIFKSNYLKPTQQFWQINSQVNFCSIAYATVDDEHEDDPALKVLGRILDHQYLHPAIREKGGAYGGGCTQNSRLGSFRFYSYRDPRVTGTLNDFKQSLEWAKTATFDAQWIEEAILSIVSSIDKPLTAPALARSAFYSERSGRSRQDYMQYKQRIMSVDQTAISKVANKYFNQDSLYQSVIGGESAKKEIPEHFTTIAL